MSHAFGEARPQAAWFKLALSATALAALSACGGGGGGSDKQSSSTTDNSAAAQPAAVETRTGEKIKLGGVVSKGLLGHANVNVWPVKDGAVDRTLPLATGVTDDDGQYLTGEFTVPGPFIVEVTAKACEDTRTGINADKTTCSYHQDEALGAKQYLPSAFNISAVVTAPPANVDNVSHVNVTLFSDFAIRAALKAAGGLTPTNMAKAQAMVNNLFGTTDLNTVVPKALPKDGSDALTPAEARLAAMLAAASHVASSTDALQAIGCADIAAGTPQATLCAAQQLAGNATIDRYVGTSSAVTAQLNSALQDVVAASGSADLAAVTSTTSDKLTNPSLNVPAPADDAGAYTAVKNFFADLVSAVRTLFTSTDGEAAIKQARAFEAPVKNLRIAADVLTTDGGVLQKGVELWNAFDQGSADPTKFEHRDVGSPRFLPTGLHCKLQVDTGGNVYSDATASTAPADIARATCRADYAYVVNWSAATGSGSVYSYPAKSSSHVFIITRSSTTAYSYSGFAVTDTRTVTLDYSIGESTDTSPSSRTFLQNTSGTGTVSGSGNGTGVPPATVKLWSGTMTASINPSTQELSALQITGDVPEGLDQAGALYHASTSPNLAHVQLSAQLTNTPNGSTNDLTFAGNMAAQDATGNSTEYSVAFSNGHLTVGNSKGLSMSFDATLQASNAKFVGSLNAVRQVNTVVDGGQATVTGKVYNLTDSTSPFIEAAITYAQDNSHYDNTKPFAQGSNYVLATVSFDGDVTAPNSPKLRVALTGAATQYADHYSFGLDGADAISGDYFIYNRDGSLKRDVTFTARAPAGKPAGVSQVVTEIVDPTNKVAFGFGYNGYNNSGDTSKPDTRAKVYVNKIERGTLDSGTGNLPLVTLTNGESFSLDTGTIQY